MIQLSLLLFALIAAPAVQARTLFEGYYRIEVKGQHRGYVIQRHEYDETKKERIMTYYIWRKDEGVVAQTGVRAVSSENLRPSKYTLFEWLNGNSSLTTGTFGPKSLQLTKHDGLTKKVIDAPESVPVPSETIFSSYITQVLAKANPEAYKDGLNISFTGFSEESAQFDQGQIKILRSNPFANQMIYQVLSTFENEDIELFTFRNGELLGSRNALLDSVTYLTPSKELALGEFKMEAASVKKVFGDIPHGATNNPISQSSGAIDAKEILKFFPKLSEIDRKPNSKSPPKPFTLPKN